MGTKKSNTRPRLVTQTEQTHIPPIDPEKSIDDWDAFYRRAEPTRAICAKIMAKRTVVQVDTTPKISNEKETVKPKKPKQRKIKRK